jgi:GTP-binding protein
MKFIDEAKIVLEAGDGGNGCVSFRREKFVPKGGPDGGDGGHGGSVFMVGSIHKASLIDFSYQRVYRAKRGGNGRGKNMTGRDGEDIVIPVPLGTDVYDQDRDLLIGEVLKDNQKLLVVRGGAGGRGNTRFKSAVRQTPVNRELGQGGEKKTVLLNLRLLADAGIVGLPNAGKSTLLSKLTAAQPKIASYPFTTLTPNLGVVKTETSVFVVADLPGLVKGAHQGKGLGTRFLRHIERVGILIFLIDITRPDPIQDFRMLVEELRGYNPEILKKRRLVVINKIDLADRPINIDREKIIHISALKGTNLDLLSEAIRRQVD